MGLSGKGRLQFNRRRLANDSDLATEQSSKVEQSPMPTSTIGGPKMAYLAQIAAFEACEFGNWMGFLTSTRSEGFGNREKEAEYIASLY